jgi:hypothetical protein
MYVIADKSGKGYVTKPGSKHSFARSLQRARKFATREVAYCNSCIESEIVVDLDYLLDNHKGE